MIVDPQLIQTLSLTLVVIVSCLFLLWIVSTIQRDVSLVDPFWGTGFTLVAWGALLWNPPIGWRPLLLTVLTSVWGLRLSAYLLWRNWGHHEDRRYNAMRKHYGSRFWWFSLIVVFLLQGLLLWFISWPQQLTAIRKSSNPLELLDFVGIAVWTIGFLFESVGDFQLSRFKADPANAEKVMDRGLWRYTRHPNYFGDFCVWWGIYLIAVNGGAGWTILSPLLMSFLLLKVSGVALLERDINERRPDYAAYRARTNAFFPGRPKVNTNGSR